LVILVDLDNILAPTAGIVFEKLQIFEHHTLKAEKEAGGCDNQAESLGKWVEVIYANGLQGTQNDNSFVQSEASSDVIRISRVDSIMKAAKLILQVFVLAPLIFT